MYYAIYKNSLTYRQISRDCTVIRSPQVNMSAQARPPRCAMVTYSRKSSSNRCIRIKRVTKKMSYLSRNQRIATYVLRKARLAINQLTKKVEKGKQAKVVITRTDLYEIFRMSTSDYDLEWKSMMKTAKSKKKGNKSDIAPKKQDNEVTVRDLQIDIPDENAFLEYVETDKDGGHNDNIHVETPMDTKDRTVSKDTDTSIPGETDT